MSCLYVSDELFFLLTTTSYQAGCLTQPGPQAGHPGWCPTVAWVGVEESIGRQRRGREWRSPLGGGGSGAGPGVRAGFGVSGADGGRRAHRGGADRARQAAAADAGRQRRAAGQGAQVPGLRRLRCAHRPGRRCALALARQRHRRHPVLPLRRPQLLTQDSFPSPTRKHPPYRPFIYSLSRSCITSYLLHYYYTCHFLEVV